MSILFTERGSTIWDVSNSTGLLAVGYLRSLESVVGIPSGLSDIIANEVHVDGPQLLNFVEAAVSRLGLSHSPTFERLFRLPLYVAIGLCRASSADQTRLEAVVDPETFAEAISLVRPPAHSEVS